MLTKEQTLTEQTLAKFFVPQGVAVIGASKDPAKVGNAVVKNLLASNYGGNIYPVNPKEGEIFGLKCYPNVKDIPPKTKDGDGDNVELAVIAIPAAFVLKALEDCAQRGIRYTIVITAGFKEIGPQGMELEKKLTAFCREQKIRLLGPNCVGLIHTHTPINASFSRGIPHKGNIAFISQSGAILLSILDWSQMAGIGFSHFVSLGNKADLQETDFLEYAAWDPATKVILCYLEDITFGQKFLEVATRVSAHKPIVVLKSGSSPSGARAASSHTGALAGTDNAYDAAFRKSAVLRAHNMGELFDIAAAFAHQPLPVGDKIAIVTNSGGPGILATDRIEKTGLRMAGFTTETKKQLRSHLPKEASIYNPVDILGDAGADRYYFTLEKVLQDPQVEAVIALFCPTALSDPAEISRAIVDVQQKAPQKPLLTVLMGGKEIQAGKDVLLEAGIPSYTFPENAVTALEGMVRYAKNKNRLMQRKTVQPGEVKITAAKKGDMQLPEKQLYNTTQVKASFYDALMERRVVLSEHEGIETLNAFNIPTAKTFLAKDPQEAAEKAELAGFPVVLKVASPQILHKSDIGGVVPNLNNPEEVKKHFREIMQRVQHFYPNAPLFGITVQKMMPPGMEIIIGSSEDVQFGPLLVFGLGGIYVNLFEDVSMRLAANLHEQDVEEMIKETKAYNLIKGFRGSNPLDLQALKNAILNTAQLVTNFPEIKEMDINPLLVYEKGVCAVDVKITLSHRLLNNTFSPREQAVHQENLAAELTERSV